MSKTNHQRDFKSNESTPKGFIGYCTDALDGSIIVAGGGFGGDYCNGKHGQAREKRGAKKFIHSRRRRKDRDTINQIDINSNKD